MRSKKAIRGCRNSRSPTQSLEQKVMSHHLPQATPPLKSQIEPEWSAWWGIEWPSAWLWSVWNAAFESSCRIHNTRHMRTCDLQAVSDKQRDRDQGSENRTLICTWVLIPCEPISAVLRGFRTNSVHHCILCLLCPPVQKGRCLCVLPCVRPIYEAPVVYFLENLVNLKSSHAGFLSWLSFRAGDLGSRLWDWTLSQALCWCEVCLRFSLPFCMLLPCSRRGRGHSLSLPQNK